MKQRIIEVLMTLDYWEERHPVAAAIIWKALIPMTVSVFASIIVANILVRIMP